MIRSALSLLQGEDERREEGIPQAEEMALSEVWAGADAEDKEGEERFSSLAINPMKKIKRFLIVMMGGLLLGVGFYLWQKFSLPHQGWKEKLKILPHDLSGKLANWASIWQEVIPEFNLNSLVEEKITKITGWLLPYDSERTDNQWRSLLYIYSPDKSKFLDINIGVEIWQEGKEIKIGFGPDQGVMLVDLKKREGKMVLFTGPSGGYNEAFWLDDETFLVAGYKECSLEEEIYYLPLLIILSLPRNEAIQFVGPKVTEKDFARINSKLWQNRERRIISALVNEER